MNADEVSPAPLADSEFSSGCTNVTVGGHFQRFNFDMATGESVEATVTGDNTATDGRVFLRGETNAQVERDIDGSGAATVSTIATSSGRWSVAVLIREATGTVNYDVLVN